MSTELDARDIVDMAGMSARPEFYSGRGASYGDLDSTKLTRIHAALVRYHGEAAGTAFVQMVADIGVLSATAFLQCLYRLEASDWVWDKSSNTVRHFCVLNDDEQPERTIAHGMANIVEMRSGPKVDNTEAIRGPFLQSHGFKVPDPWMALRSGRR